MAAEKKYKLDLFKELLPALDKRDFKFYSQLSNEEKKGFAGIVALRAISGYSDANKNMCEYFIGMANETNKHFWNPSIAKNHTELQLLVDINTEDELIEIVKMIGTQDDELKEFKKVVKKLKK